MVFFDDLRKDLPKMLVNLAELSFNDKIGVSEKKSNKAANFLFAPILSKGMKSKRYYNSDAARFLALVKPKKKVKRVFTKEEYKAKHIRSTMKEADTLDDMMDYAIWKDK